MLKFCDVYFHTAEIGASYFGNKRYHREKCLLHVILQYPYILTLRIAKLSHYFFKVTCYFMKNISLFHDHAFATKKINEITRDFF